MIGQLKIDRSDIIYNILVTGGCGFIGSNFIDYMISKYPKRYNILNVDCLTYAGNIENTNSFKDNPNYQFHRCDITNKSAMAYVFKNNEIDYIVNFAAESHVDRSITNPFEFINTNIVGTHILLEEARKYSIRKFVQISTDEVYGSLGSEGYFTEETPISPNSPYSASKASADLLVKAYYETYELPINITRCSNNYGRYQHPEKLIPKIITNALRDIEIPVYGDGLNIRDWIHVEDHCEAIDLILHMGKFGEVYNIGSYNEMTNIDIVKAILKYLDKPESLIKYVEDRKGHDKRYAIEAQKIINEFCWLPRYDIDNGIKETIDWYVNNEEWWQKLV
jgi:dTDP-glucose 4,6-dehydratase